jgi:5-methylcytosine-specific restriction protein A
MADPRTLESFRRALAQTSANDLQILRTQYSAPGHRMTTRELAAALGVGEPGSGNLAYGTMAKRMAERIGFTPERIVRTGSRPEGDPMWWSACSSGVRNGDEFAWVMLRALAQALEEGGYVRPRQRRGIPDGITTLDVLDALGDLERGIDHPFGPSTGYDLLFKGKRFPPKAVVGLAARRIMGETLRPEDFTGGRSSKSFCILEQAGFSIVTKADVDPFPDEVPDAGEYAEGALRQVVVNRYERDPTARQACIAHYGASCGVCGFEFRESYGPIGEGFIHVHHLVPLANIGAEYVVNPVRDLRPVCPNCHAMLHKRNPPFGIDELRELIALNRTA